MSRIVVRRVLIAGQNMSVAMAVLAATVVTAVPAEAGIGSRSIDPAQIVPLNQIAPDRREWWRR